jgi:hypothetical protein
MIGSRMQTYKPLHVVLIGAVVVNLTLAQCSLPFTTNELPVPPASTPISLEDTSNSNLNTLAESLEREMRALVRLNGYRLSEQQRLSVAETPENALAFYQNAFEQQGWERAVEIPAATSLFYTRGNQLVIVAIFDGTTYAQSGSIVFVFRAEQ